ncbi:hypothetical protein ACFL59_08130 [Planctomycetota bacterium]
MRVKCPVCNQHAEYKPQYAHKWHKCTAGCQAGTGTRMILIPDGTGRAEEDVRKDWKRGVGRGRLFRGAIAVFGLVLSASPALGAHWGLSAAGVVTALIFGYAAFTFDLPKPPGL